MESCMAPACALVQSTPGSTFTTLIQTIMASYCALNVDEYPTNRAEEIFASKKEEFDFIIVGSGSAGSILASRLTEIEDWDVLLIERGEDPLPETYSPALFIKNINGPQNYHYLAEYQNGSCLGIVHQRCKWEKGKALGGSSVTAGMLYVIGNEKTYNDWQVLGNEGWNFENVLPYFTKSTSCSPEYVSKHGTKYCGEDGPMRIRHFHPSPTDTQRILMDGLREAGHRVLEEVNGDRFIGFGRAMATVYQGRRENAALTFLSPAKGRKNLRVMKSSMVEKVLLEDGRAIGVRVRSEGDRGTVVDVRARKEVILSAGSLATPQVLMLSGIGPREQLERMGIPVVADRPVGTNLQDHLVWGGIFVTFESKEISNDSLIAYDLLVTMNVNDPDSKYPDVQLMFIHFERYQTIELSVLLDTIGFQEEMVEKMRKEVERTSVILVFSILLEPKSRGVLELNSTDPAVPVRIYTNYLVEREDTRTLVKTVGKIKDILNTETLRKHGMRFNYVDVPGCRHLNPDTDEYWECSVRHVSVSYYHPCGTTRMGPANDSRTVVDSRLRVHGVRGLRVIDGSIIPRIPAANVIAAVMMIAEKGADIVKQDWDAKKR